MEQEKRRQAELERIQARQQQVEAEQEEQRRKIVEQREVIRDMHADWLVLRQSQMFSQSVTLKISDLYYPLVDI